MSDEEEASLYWDDDELSTDAEPFYDTDQDLPDNATDDQLIQNMASLPQLIVPSDDEAKMNRRSETKKFTLEELEKLLPSLKEQSPSASSDFNLLTDLVGDFVDQDNLRDDTKERKEQIRSICKTVMDVYPKRCFYQLITRWSRKRKLDYIKDSLNTVLVLNSHFPDLTLTQFLNNCRDITVSPSSKTEKTKYKKKLSISINTNLTKRGINNSDQIVHKIIVLSLIHI